MFNTFRSGDAMLLSIYWNPDPLAFTLPFFGIPIFWYGVLFTVGFLLGYLLFRSLLTEKLKNKDPSLAQELTDKITSYVLIGTIIGARLGHVFFYDWPRYQKNFLLIFNLREGGLASHGAAVAIPLFLLLFTTRVKKQYPSHQFNFWDWVDLLVIPTALAGSCIRLGNFINQELVGTPTSLPWGVLFGNPMGGYSAIPRHPVQLYEAFAYLFTFFLLLYLFKKSSYTSGFLSGIFFLCVFLSRFVLEYFKTPQSLLLDESLLSAGQLLSIPFIFLGLILIRKSLIKKVKRSF
jgi:phosphatidylglycerol:prolipoprotein diacylglycerol transferase